METGFKIGKEIFPVRMNGVEEYLQILLDNFHRVHRNSDAKIFFSKQKWGLIEKDQFIDIDIGNFDQLLVWFQTHCQKCEKFWKSL